MYIIIVVFIYTHIIDIQYLYTDKSYHVQIMYGKSHNINVNDVLLIIRYLNHVYFAMPINLFDYINGRFSTIEQTTRDDEKLHNI